MPWHNDTKTSQSSWVKPDWEVDYFVPDFGLDQDISDSLAHTEYAEAKAGRKMTSSFKKPKGPPLDYYVPDFGIDQDILDTRENIHEAEHKYGKWKVEQDEYGNFVVPGADNSEFKFR